MCNDVVTNTIYAQTKKVHQFSESTNNYWVTNFE